MFDNRQRAVVLGAGLIAVLLLLLALWPRDKTPASTAGATAGPAKAPAPRLQERAIPERPRVAPEPDTAPAPEPAAPDGEPQQPPPLTALILTFPTDMPAGDMQALLEKCNVVEVRRSGEFVRVLPGAGTSFAQIEKCFRFGDVVVSEERGGPPPGSGR